ncbi:trypsin-like peptidase domain-containing protein [Streptomyces sp. NPDC052051]|uniref:nSTAND1 domain-containing NTPase n=1 Tax=Streptomyces sp. NPDC052051 TaxID=3154649 RepID=UPI00341C1C07
MTFDAAAHSRSPETALAAAVVRVSGAGTGADARTGGAGFVVAPDLVLTCAHVVADALDRPRRETPAPGAEVVVELVLAGGARSRATVAHWVPIRDDGTGDIAVLRLRTPLPRAEPLGMAGPGTAWGHDVRVFGLPDHSPGGIWYVGRLRGETAEGWVQLSGADAQGAPIEEGFSGSPVWDEQTGAVVGMVFATQLSGAQQSFLIPTRTLIEEVPALAAVLDPASPFRSLVPFQEADAGVFFGRDAEAEAVVALLTGNAGHPWVTLVGPSGCGKSSLALAGVVPRLRARGYEVITLRATESGSLRSALAAARARSDRTDGLPPLLIVLDQAESLLARTDRALEEAVRILFPEHPEHPEYPRRLEHLERPEHANRPERRAPGVQVLLTLRSDFLEAALSHPLIGPALSRGAMSPLAPMRREQLDQVVRRPVEALPAVDYDPGLVRRIVDDADHQPGVLPLLGFVLGMLWEDQSVGRLRFATYEAIGGVGGALGRHAESVWDTAVGEGERDDALRLLTALVRVLPGGEAPLRAVLGRAEAGPERWRIAEALARGRILVLGTDPERGQTVELAHEALITAWPTLAEQVARNREFLAWRAELRHAIDNWRGAGQEAEQLLAGERLEEARRMLAERPDELTAEERRFVEESERRRAAAARAVAVNRRIKRALTGLLAAATAVVLVVALLYVAKNHELDSQLRRAASDQLASQAEQLDDVSLTTSGLFSAAAYATADGAEARSALIAQYLRTRNVDHVVLDGLGEVEDIAVSEDGRRMHTLLRSGETVDLDLDSGGARTAKRSLVKGNGTALLRLSPDGSVSARASDWGHVSLGLRTGKTWRNTSLRGNADVRRNPRAATDLRFDATGRRVLAAVPGEGVLVWRVEGGRRLGKALTAPDGWEVTQAWFGADEDTVIGRLTPRDAAEDAAGRLATWRLGSGQRRTPWGTGTTGRVTVSGDGGTLVRCTPEGILEAWDLSGTPKIRRSYDNRVLGLLCPLYTPRLDRTGRYLLNPARRVGTTLSRYQFLVLDIDKGRPGLLELPAPAQQDQVVTGQAQVPAVAFTGPPDALRATVTTGGSVVTAQVRVPTAFDSDMLLSRIRTIDADHRRITSVSTDGTALRLWDLTSHRLLGQARPSRTLAQQYASYTPDGKRLLTVSADGRSVLVWRLTDASGSPALTEDRRFDLPTPPGVDGAGADKKTGLTPAWVNVSFQDDDHAVISAMSYVSRWRLSTGRIAGEVYHPAHQDPAEIANAAANTFATARPGHPQAAVRTADYGRIEIWDFDKGRSVETLSRKQGYRSVKDVRFAPTGDLLAVLEHGGMVRLWDMTGKKWREPLTYDGVYWLGAFFSADTLGTQAPTNEFTVWDVHDRSEKYHFMPGYGATSDLTSDGGQLAYVDGGDARLISLDPADWTDRVCALAGRELTSTEKELAPPGSRVDDLCEHAR